jgi:hypothetical protein
VDAITRIPISSDRRGKALGERPAEGSFVRSMGARPNDTGAVLRILVVVDGILSILDCGRLSRDGAPPRDAGAAMEAVLSVLGSASSASPSPRDGVGDHDRCDGEHEQLRGERGEGQASGSCPQVCGAAFRHQEESA